MCSSDLGTLLLTLQEETNNSKDVVNPPKLLLPSVPLSSVTKVSPPLTSKSTVDENSHPNFSPTPSSSLQLEGLSMAEDNRIPSLAAISLAQDQDPSLSSIKCYLTQSKGWQQLDANVRLESNRCIIVDKVLYIWVLEQRSTRKKRKEARI